MLQLTLLEIAEAVNGRLVGEQAVISKIITDSRKMAENALFVAIKGDRFDGHNFIESAISEGAAAFITEKTVDICQKPYILVKDTRQALLDLAAYYRSMFKIPAVAVTGSSGKTSVKNAIAAVLSQKYSVLKTDGNYNNEIGLPLTVFGLDDSYEAAVFELGMNSFGEISHLSKAVKPEIGVITNVGTAHIEGLGSRTGILKAKMEITDGMNEDGTLILNYDNDMLRKVNALKQKIMWVSAFEKADVYAEIISENSVTIRHNDRRFTAAIQIPAGPLVANMLLAAAAGFLYGLTDDEIKRGLESPIDEDGRLKILTNTQGATIIDDSYNANADSMQLAIDILCSFSLRTGKKKIAVLGDMLELGSYAPAFHEDIGAYAADKGIDLLIAVGKDAELYKKAFDKNKGKNQQSRHYYNKKDLFDKEELAFGHGQLVLVKASHGMGLDEVVRTICQL